MLLCTHLALICTWLIDRIADIPYKTDQFCVVQLLIFLKLWVFFLNERFDNICLVFYRELSIKVRHCDVNFFSLDHRKWLVRTRDSLIISFMYVDFYSLVTKLHLFISSTYLIVFYNIHISQVSIKNYQYLVQSTQILHSFGFLNFDWNIWDITKGSLKVVIKGKYCISSLWRKWATG